MWFLPPRTRGGCVLAVGMSQVRAAGFRSSALPEHALPKQSFQPTILPIVGDHAELETCEQAAGSLSGFL